MVSSLNKALLDRISGCSNRLGICDEVSLWSRNTLRELRVSLNCPIVADLLLAGKNRAPLDDLRHIVSVLILHEVVQISLEFVE